MDIWRAFFTSNVLTLRMQKKNNPKVDFNSIQTPAFVLEEERLRQNLEILAYVQKEADIDIVLALKGFSMYHAFDLIKPYLKGTTASSLHEARLGATQFGGESHVYAPAYNLKDFDLLCQYATHFSFNSINQFEQFKERLFANNPNAHAGLRINPNYSEVETPMYNPCIPGSRLGIRPENMPAKLPMGISFLHCHNLCESNSFALEQTLLSIEKLYGHLLPQIKLLNLGGGHLMTKVGYDLEHLIALLKYYKYKYSNLSIMLEPGSAVAWDTGYLVASVLDIVDSAGIQVAILDCSVAAHMPDVLEMPYKPTVLGASEPSGQKSEFVYRFGGQTCLAGDYVGDYAFSEPLKAGDKIVFNDMMHYTMVKTTTFNGVNLPDIGIWRTNNQYEIVKQFGYDEFLARL